MQTLTFPLDFAVTTALDLSPLTTALLWRGTLRASMTLRTIPSEVFLQQVQPWRAGQRVEARLKGSHWSSRLGVGRAANPRTL